MTSERKTCTIIYPDGERCDRPDKGGGLCSGHQNRRSKLGDPLAGGKLATRRKADAPCSIGREAPWLDEAECPNGHYAKGFCSLHYQRFTIHGNPLVTLIAVDHPDTCSVDGCDEPYDSAGLCHRHYNRAWLHSGDPHGGTRIDDTDERLRRRTVEGPIPEQFYNPITDAYNGVPPCPCRDWTSTTLYGYGVLSADGHVRRVHRVTYEQANGPIPDGLHLDHLCRRTICCEPRHMEPVTPSENSRRQHRAYVEALSLDAVGALIRPQYEAWVEGRPVPPISADVLRALREPPA